MEIGSEVDVGKADLSPEYVRAILDKAREFLPDWMMRQLHKVAFPVSSGRARWHSPEKSTYLEKLALADMRPERLAKVPDDEIRQAWLRLHQWFSQARRRKEAIEDIVNAAVWVMAEFDKRGFKYDPESELVQEAKKLTEVCKGDGFDLTKSFRALPQEVVIVQDFIGVVGSAAEGQEAPRDVDVLLRAHSQELGGQDHLLIQRENVWLPIRKVLDPDKSRQVHFIENPQGAHADHIPLYDLVLRRKTTAGRVVVKSQPTESDVHVDRPLGGDGKPKRLRIDLGCGRAKPAGYMGFDKAPGDGVDYTCDLERGVPLPDNSVEEVRANHILEHLMDKEKIMAEIHRVLQPGGRLVFEVPSTKGEGAFAHPDHKSWWNKSSFAFWTDDRVMDKRPKFEVEKLEEVEAGDNIVANRVYVRGILRKPAEVEKARTEEEGGRWVTIMDRPVFLRGPGEGYSEVVDAKSGEVSVAGLIKNGQVDDKKLDEASNRVEELRAKWSVLANRETEATKVWTDLYRQHSDMRMGKAKRELEAPLKEAADKMVTATRLAEKAEKVLDAERVRFAEALGKESGAYGRLAVEVSPEVRSELDVSKGIQFVSAAVGSGHLMGKAYFSVCPPKENRGYTDEKGNVFLHSGANHVAAVHELGHSLEYRRDDVYAASAGFLADRWKASRGPEAEIKQLGGGFGRGETGFRDKFFDPYVGSIYKTLKGTEVFSMGLHALYENPAAFKRDDPGHYHFTLGVIRMVARNPSPKLGRRSINPAEWKRK